MLPGHLNICVNDPSHQKTCGAKTVDVEAFSNIMHHMHMRNNGQIWSRFWTGPNRSSGGRCEILASTKRIARYASMRHLMHDIVHSRH